MLYQNYEDLPICHLDRSRPSVVRPLSSSTARLTDFSFLHPHFCCRSLPMTWNRSGQFKRMLSLGACGSGDREPSPGGDFLSKATLSYKPIYKQTLDCAHAANILRKDRWPNYFRENTSQRAEGRKVVGLRGYDSPIWIHFP